MATVFSAGILRRCLSRMAQDVQHRKNAFFVSLGNGIEAVLEYEEVQPKLWDMHHTEVPEELRGKGIAGQLAKAALDHATTESIKVRLSCSYLQHYVTKHEQYKHLVVK